MRVHIYTHGTVSVWCANKPYPYFNSCINYTRKPTWNMSCMIIYGNVIDLLCRTPGTRLPHNSNGHQFWIIAAFEWWEFSTAQCRNTDIRYRLSFCHHKDGPIQKYWVLFDFLVDFQSRRAMFALRQRTHFNFFHLLFQDCLSSIRGVLVLSFASKCRLKTRRIPKPGLFSPLVLRTV